MRRRRPPEPETPDGVPAMLAIGRCIEVYGAHEHDAIGAYRAWGDARDAWLAEQGIGERDYHRYPDSLRDHAPWSYADLVERDPDQLARRLERAGLAADWRP